MKRGNKLVSLRIGGKEYHYYQPGWWCSLDDPNDLEGQLTDEDNLVAAMAERNAKALSDGEVLTPVAIRALRVKYRLSQAEAGKAFGTGAKSFEKYESGEIRPSEPTKRLMWLAMKHPALLRELKQSATTNDIRLIKGTVRSAKLDKIYGPMIRTDKSTRRRKRQPA